MTAPLLMNQISTDEYCCHCRERQGRYPLDGKHYCIPCWGHANQGSLDEIQVLTSKQRSSRRKKKRPGISRARPGHAGHGLDRATIERAASRYPSNILAGEALGISPGSFARACKRWGIETPLARRQREAKTR